MTIELADRPSRTSAIWTGLARIVWIGAAVAWGARSLIGFAEPEYWAPVTTVDWVAVWLFSVRWTVLAPAVLLLGWLSSWGAGAD